MVTNGSELSLVSEVKQKQDQDPIFLEYQANFSQEKYIGISTKGKWCAEVSWQVVFTKG